MAYSGLGTDIVEIARIEAVIARSGDRLLQDACWSDNEWGYLGGASTAGALSAKRFRGKRGGGRKRSARVIVNGLAF